MTGVGNLLQSFFEDCLQSQRGLRPGSVRNYRHTVKLLLVHVAEQLRLPVMRLALQHLTCEAVLGFLNWFEQELAKSPRTRNQRLAALRGFFRYAATRCPQALAEAQRLETIPTKRYAPSGTTFLERDEIEALLPALPTEGLLALGNRALLMLLYRCWGTHLYRNRCCTSFGVNTRGTTGNHIATEHLTEPPPVPDSTALLSRP